MNTPAGAPCAYYYEDFRRGADIQECRADTSPHSAEWQPGDCARCPVPGILAANGSPFLRLRIDIRPGFLRMGRHVDVEARCHRHGPIADPHVGCRVCNTEADELLREALG